MFYYLYDPVLTVVLDARRVTSGRDAVVARTRLAKAREDVLATSETAAARWVLRTAALVHGTDGAER